MRPATSPPHLITLVLLTAFSTLSLNMFLPSLANIARDLRADYALVSLSIGGYLAATAVVQLVVGPLSDRFGRRAVLLWALVIFTLASLGGALAHDIWTLLVFRMLQGSMISGYALSLAIVRDTRTERQAAGLIGYISMAMALASMLGPMLGGILDAAFGWRANFILYFAGGCVLVLVTWSDLGETRAAASGTRDGTLRGLPDLVRSPRFWGYALCMAASIGAFYAFLAGAPLVATSVLRMSSAEVGLCLGSITAGFALGSFASGRLAPRYALTTMMLAGRLVACLGLLGGLLILATGWIGTITYFGATIFVGLGNGLTMPSSNAGAMSVRPRLAGSAAGLAGALTVGGGAVLSTLTGFVLTAENAAAVLLAIMLAASLAGLLSALWVRYLERAHARGLAPE